MEKRVNRGDISCHPDSDRSIAEIFRLCGGDKLSSERR